MSRTIYRENYYYTRNEPKNEKVVNLKAVNAFAVREPYCDITPQRLATFAPQYGYPYATYSPPRHPTAAEQKAWVGVL